MRVRISYLIVTLE